MKKLKRDVDKLKIEEEESDSKRQSVCGLLKFITFKYDNSLGRKYHHHILTHSTTLYFVTKFNKN